MSFFASRFAGRTAVITGGASGLGLETAKRITAEGGRVALWDVDPEGLEEARQMLGSAVSHVTDVSNHSMVAAAAAQSRQALGRIDILVASAGITGATEPVVGFPIDSWNRVMDVNLTGLFYCCREIVPHMLENGYGRIVNVASVAGKEGNPSASAYSASKGGVIAFTKSLGKELATKGVLVNCITPATFESAILQQMPQSQIDYMKSKIPMGRLGETSENAALVCWLASEECSFSTAATFDISGGRTTY
ncbi:MAG TPA: SDR family NAD(P)-dependent oxidoreductase [Rhizomicrobium sp.]|jgi:3-oxoacyl-[acyl-carrier protein] reductase|nr:SDR family NAD(P)-dependent oxidoreductase [Rhizomicrobium sp.]